MKICCFFILLLSFQSCATKKHTHIRQWEEGIHSATEKKYRISQNSKKLLYTKEYLFTRNGRIKYSKTTDSLGNLIQETQKRLWFVVESYPDKENYYCKTRWKPGQRERISCYTRKQFKQNEAIYQYNPDGTIAKITDRFPPFFTQFFDYKHNYLSKISIKAVNDSLIDEIQIHCINKDEKGNCLKEIRQYSKSTLQEEIDFYPKYQ